MKEKQENNKPQSRKGKKQVTAWFIPDVQKSIRRLALDEDTSVQALLGEAINLLFKNRGKEPPVKPDNDL